MHSVARNSVAILRCVDFGEAEDALLERLRSYFGSNVVVLLNIESDENQTSKNSPKMFLSYG